jgi:hypothetical protein
MFHIECQGCHTSTYTEDVADPDAALVCPPGTSCCQQDHHHGQMASSCSGGHGACPTPDSCPVWLGQQPHHPGTNQRDTAAGPCPGGHCGLGVAGCTVCRPLKITAIPGSVNVRRVTSGG